MAHPSPPQERPGQAVPSPRLRACPENRICQCGVSSCSLRRCCADPGTDVADHEEQAKDDRGDTDPGNDIGVLTPQHEQLRDDEWPCNVAGPFQEAVACGDRISTDPV